VVAALFVPSLALQDHPDVAARLHALARAARGDPHAVNVAAKSAQRPDPADLLAKGRVNPGLFPRCWRSSRRRWRRRWSYWLACRVATRVASGG
jgi:hypothetical protein